MNLDKQKSSKKRFYGKLALLFIWIFIFVDNTGLGERTKVEQLAIIDKYFVESNTIKRNNSSTTIPEHYRFVFMIRNKKVDMQYFDNNHEDFNIGDKVTVEYKIPINIFRKPYITSYDFN